MTSSLRMDGMKGYRIFLLQSGIPKLLSLIPAYNVVVGVLLLNSIESILGTFLP